MYLEVTMKEAVFHLDIRKKKNKKRLVIFEDKLSHVMCQRLLQRWKYIKLGPTNIFTGFKSPRKLWLMFFEAKRINKVRRDDFTGCKTLRKIQPMYLEFALKEGKFN